MCFFTLLDIRKKKDKKKKDDKRMINHVYWLITHAYV